MTSLFKSDLLFNVSRPQQLSSMKSPARSNSLTFLVDGSPVSRKSLMQKKKLNARSAVSLHSDRIDGPKSDGLEYGGSPQRSEISATSDRNSYTYSHLHKDETVGLEITLDAFNSEDLQQIPIQTFHDIESQIGKLSMTNSMVGFTRNRSNSISRTDQSMDFYDRQSTSHSTHRVNTLPVIEESSLNNSRVSTIEIEEYNDISTLVSNVVQYLLSSGIVIPENRCKLYWDRLILTTLLYTAILTPFQIAFDCSMNDIVYLELFLSVLFILDIWISIRTTYRSSKNGEYVIDRRYVQRHYLRTWFLFDVVAALPVFEILVFAQADRSWQHRFVSLHFLRFTKLYRARSLFPPHSARTGFVALIVVLLFICHWSACTLSMFVDIKNGSTTFQQYVVALHWTISIGFGASSKSDVVAVSWSLTERIYSILSTLMAAILYSMLFASMSLIFGEKYHSESLYARHSTECHQFATALHFSANLKHRIAALNRFEKDKVYGSNLEYLMRSCNFPNSVKYAILQRTLKPILVQNGAFRFVPDHILLFLAENLSLSVSLPNEFLFKANDVMSRVYIVQEGLIRIFNGKLNEQSIELCRLSAGSHFGEVSFFQQHEDYLDERVTARSKLATRSAFSHTFCVLFTLSYVAFKDVLMIDSRNYKMFKAIAEHRNKQSQQYDDQQLCQIIASRINNIGMISGVHFGDIADSVATVQ